MNREALATIAHACRDISEEIETKLASGSDVDVAELARALTEFGALAAVIVELNALPEPPEPPPAAPWFSSSSSSSSSN